MLAQGISPSDVIEHLLEEQSFPQLQAVLMDLCGLDLKRIKGPVGTDADSFYWPIQIKREAMMVEGIPAIDSSTGIASYIVDCLTSFHMLLVEERRTHVTINLSISCLRPIPSDRRIVVKTYVRTNTSSAIMLEALFVDEADEKIVYVSGQHTKMFYRVPPTAKKAKAKL